MDFNDFSLKVRSLTELGWETRLLDLPCAQHPHNHLKLRLRKPRTNTWLSPLEAIRLALLGNKDARSELLNYHDKEISLHGIEMATEYVDWLRSGYTHYVYARMALLDACNIEEEQVLKLAPHPRKI